MMPYYIATVWSVSGQALYDAPSIDAARQALAHNEGARNVKNVRPATDDEIEWHKAMGGSITVVTAREAKP